MSIITLDSHMKNFSEAIIKLNATLVNLNQSINPNMSKAQAYFDTWAKFSNRIPESDNIYSIKNNKVKQASFVEKNSEELEKERVALRDKKIKKPENMSDALSSAGYRIEDEFGNTFKNIQTIIVNSAIAMRESMSTFFFDAMTGKLKTAEEYFKSFLTSIQKALAQFLANEITNKLIKTLFGSLLDDGNTNNKIVSLSERDKYPSITIPKAAGGRVSAGNQLIAGESGPELINLDGAGATVISNNTTQSMLAGQNNLAVEVNVINQSGTQMQASQGESRFDGPKYVVDVFLDAWARDVSGLRTAVGGRR